MLSKRNKEALFNPLSKDNPVLVQILGICSTLAVTAKLEPAIVMGISVIAVLAILIIVQQVLRAYAYDVSLQLSVFIGLIITNCILMGRLEAFALSNKPWPAFLDGIGNGLGYMIILVIVAFFRELLGSGTLLNYHVIPQWCYDHGYMDNGLMILPPMALITVGCIVWVHRSRNKDLQEK